MSTDDLPDLSGVRHQYLDAGGLRTHVALAGPLEAPAVVLVHGWPQNWWSWRGVIPLLAERHRVIAVDLRGHGWTEAPASGYEKERIADDLLAVLDALAVERVTWVGHDWGGWIGQLVALRAPERIERMLMVCVPHLWIRPHPRQLMLLSYQGPLSMPFVGERLAARMVPELLQSGRRGGRLSDAEVALFAEHVPPRVSVAMYRTFLTRELVPIARGRYAGARLSMPSTLLIGAHDLVTRGIPAGRAGGQPNLRVEVAQGAAHWLPEQRPELIAEWVSRP